MQKKVFLLKLFHFKVLIRVIDALKYIYKSKSHTLDRGVMMDNVEAGKQVPNKGHYKLTD